MSICSRLYRVGVNRPFLSKRRRTPALPEIDPRPEFLYNIGRSFHRRGERNGYLADLRRAHGYYRRYIETAQDVKLAPEEMERLEAQLRDLEKARRK